MAYQQNTVALGDFVSGLMNQGLSTDEIMRRVNEKKNSDLSQETLIGNGNQNFSIAKDGGVSSLNNVLPRSQKQGIPENYNPAPGTGMISTSKGNTFSVGSQMQPGQMTLSDLMTKYGTSVNNKIDVGGGRIGYQTSDGIVGLDGNGREWKMRLSSPEDIAYRQAAEDRALKMAQANAAIEHTKAQTDQLRQKPAMPAPPGYRWTATGNLEAIPGGPADVKEDKPLTDAQGNAMLFGSRAADAHNILNELQGKYSQAGLSAKQTLENIPLFGNNLVSGIGNAILSPEQKQAQQAQINFLTAILRKESGASIAPSEFDSAAKVYFPSATDDATTIENKKRAREEAVQGLKLMAGPGAKKIDAVMEKIKSQQPVSAASSQVFSVTDPNGVVHKFPNAAAADAFKKAAGL